MSRIARQAASVRLSSRGGCQSPLRSYASAALAQPALDTRPPSAPARPAENDDPLDAYTAEVAQSLKAETPRGGSSLFAQSQKNAGVTLDDSVPYEAYPSAARRADAPVRETVGALSSAQGDGLVLVLHAVLPSGEDPPDSTVCSGFVVDASDTGESGRQLVVTCAHTLLEVKPRLQVMADSRSSKGILASPPYHSSSPPPARTTRPPSSCPSAVFRPLYPDRTFSSATSLQLRLYSDRSR